MELHDHLYALGLQVGREVFDDPEGFRGVLDDFLEEDEATTGDINLLVDAVRLGAYRSMLTMLDSGADAASAISEAGLRLARDRGSADAGSAQWACAVLGFAVGRVGEADVARFRSSTAPPMDQGPATELPPVPGPAAPPPPAPTQAFPPPAPMSQPPAPTPAYPAYQSSSYPAPDQGQPPQPPYQVQPPAPGYAQPQQSKPKTGLILALVGTAAAVVIAIVLALVLAGGGDDEKPVSADPTSEPTSEPPSSEPTTEISTEPTSEPPSSDPTSEPPVDPGGQVSVKDAGDFTQALLDFSDAFGTASTDLADATTNDDYEGALEANAAIRLSVFDLDSTVRGLDLDAVADARNEFLTQSGLMIEGLDDTYTSASTATEIGLEFGALPLQAYTDAFTELSTAITDSAYS